MFTFCFTRDTNSTFLVQSLGSDPPSTPTTVCVVNHSETLVAICAVHLYYELLTEHNIAVLFLLGRTISTQPWGGPTVPYNNHLLTVLSVKYHIRTFTFKLTYRASPTSLNYDAIGIPCALQTDTDGS